MSIALRFSDKRETACEILNDSFLKLFTFLIEGGHIEDTKPWLRKTIINKSIDYYRKNNRLKETIAFEEELPDVLLDNAAISTLNAEEIIKQLQQLSELQRLTFILFEIEGYTHKEISTKLEISEASSRKNLSRAKTQLKLLLQKSGIYEQV
jgi:RNA polymerase sigma-70 factor (ECF subfamily)